MEHQQRQCQEAVGQGPQHTDIKGAGGKMMCKLLFSREVTDSIKPAMWATSSSHCNESIVCVCMSCDTQVSFGAADCVKTVFI